MPTTHLSLHYHLVFSTKDRRELILDEWRPRLFGFMGGCINTSGGQILAVGGTRNHVHLLFALRATHRLADVVQDVKTASSKWVHTELQSRHFSWQRGYGGIYGRGVATRKVRNYVMNQEEHHRAKTFEDEYVSMLEKAGVGYDEKYLW